MGRNVAHRGRLTMNLVSVVASGLFSFFNKVIVNGLLGKAIFLVIVTWAISALIAGIVGEIGNWLQLTPVGSVLGSFGDVGAVGVWFFSFTVAPYAALAIGGRVVAFIIRRLPIVG
jgi:hypothetical protein